MSRLACLLCLLAVPSLQADLQFLGQLSMLKKDVSGDVYATGEQEIIIKNFYYDGTAPKTFVTVGTHGDPEDPDVERFIITEQGFEDNVVSPRFPVLGAAENQTLRLSLKDSDLTVSDLKWISVWCFDFKVNFGDLEFELEPENLVFLGDLRTIQHDVSGEVYASGEEEIIIKHFTYNGQAPKPYITVGIQGGPADPDVERFIVTEEGVDDDIFNTRFPVLAAADDETLILPLTGSGLRVSDLRWLSVWCVQFSVDFGSVEFQLEPEEFSGEELQQEFEDGQSLQFLGELSMLKKDVSGSVYAAGEQEIIVKNFYYDGTAPKTFFTVGRHGDPEDPDVQRFIITEEGFEANVISPRFPVLDAANDETVTLSLRGSGLTVADLKWISVWCFDFKVNFGDLEFDTDPDNFLEIEKEINLFSEEEPEESFEFDSAQDLISEEQEQDYEDFNNDYEDNTIEKVGEVDTHSNSDPEPEAEILILPEPEAEAEFLIIAEPEAEAEYTVLYIPEPEPQRHQPRLKRRGHYPLSKGHHHRSTRSSDSDSSAEPEREGDDYSTEPEPEDDASRYRRSSDSVAEPEPEADSDYITEPEPEDNASRYRRSSDSVAEPEPEADDDYAEPEPEDEVSRTKRNSRGLQLMRLLNYYF